VAHTFFLGQKDLVLLAVRQAMLGPALRFEEVEGESFPHLYGPLSLEAVEQVYELSAAPDGTFEIPEQLV